MQPEPLSGWSVDERVSKRSSAGGERLKLVGGRLSEPVEAEHARRAWFATRALRSSQFAGTCRRRPPRWLESQTGLAPRNDEPTAHAGTQTRVVPLPTGAGNGGVRSAATLDDETTAELRANLIRAAGRIGVEARRAGAKVRPRAARIRSGIAAEAMEIEIAAEAVGIEIAVTLLVDESIFSRPALG